MISTDMNIGKNWQNTVITKAYRIVGHIFDHSKADFKNSIIPVAGGLDNLRLDFPSQA